MFAFDSSHEKRNYNLSEIATKSGFKIRDITNRKLDWKALGCVDVNKVIDNQDYAFLERIIPKLIEAPMQSILSAAVLDPAVSSLFRLTQLSLQYLSFCQQFMDHTLYDLRNAYNHVQKKYSNLKYNYKCLEEQHYKAQERIQQLLGDSNENQVVNKTEQIIAENPSINVKPTSLFPCDQCTKNFLTADSLRSHQQRKHSTIEEKHELSDDNEKNTPRSYDIQETTVVTNPSASVEKDLKQHINALELETAQLNNNNNGDSNENCAECSKKLKVSLSSVAIQCDEGKLENEKEENITLAKENVQTQAKIDSITQIESANNVQSQNKIESELIQTAYDTINELKKEIHDLRNALNSKENVAEPSRLEKDQNPENDLKLEETNGRIEVMAQKFDAFEAMYTESQNKFIESFRSLDERQKTYMDNIHVTVKEIVEKSLVQSETNAGIQIVETITAENKIEVEQPNDGHLINGKLSDKNDERIVVETKSIDKPSQPKAPLTEPVNVSQPHETDSDWSSDSTEKHETMICQADVHTVDSGSDESVKPMPKPIKKPAKIISKETAVNELEDRLRQLGVDADSTGLSTPRSQEVIQELADDREEMKRSHKSFKETRLKLKNEVNRLVKEKLRSASSVTSLSSQISDDQSIEDEQAHTAKLRPKSANIQKIRKRNAKKLVQKYVDNDIDESDIMDKMEMAQKAINAHRECIQELLQTTAHAPNKITRIKCSTPSAAAAAAATTTTNGTNERQMSNGQINEINSNQYNKMPNVTTRRVVFVNLDEDS